MSWFDKMRSDLPPARFVPIDWPRRGGRGAASVFPDFGSAVGRADAAPVPEPAASAPAAAAPDAAGLEDVRRAAYAAGLGDGRAAAEQELLALGAAVTRALDELARFRRGLRDRYERDLLELALGIARKVVQRELAEHPEHWLGMIREAIRHALDRERIRIRVGSVLYRFLVERLPTLRALLEDVKELELVEDEALAENGCLVESEGGDLDLGVDSQIGAIRTALAHVT